MVRKILLLGNQKLYETSEIVHEDEINYIKEVIGDLHETLIDFRKKYKVGRAIAAPQIGVNKRLIYMYINEPIVFINPTLIFEDDETIEVIDDCMSFPEILVKVDRFKKCTINYKDVNWQDCSMILEDDLSELIQHEYDHLDGILATMRAKDKKSLFLKSEIKNIQ